jgi:hypothetical protein
MKNRRIGIVLTIAALIGILGSALVAPQIALAHSGGGSGTLTASGDGLAGIRGNGTVIISGNGILWIRDHAGDASIQVSGNGVRRELPNGWIRYTGFQGQANLSGSMITVALSGYDINLQASGTGKFVLRGNGTYSVEKDGITIVTGAWTESFDVFSLP